MSKICMKDCYCYISVQMNLCTHLCNVFLNLCNVLFCDCKGRVARPTKIIKIKSNQIKSLPVAT